MIGLQQARLAYIGLGSNMDCPRAQVRRAFHELNQLPQTRLSKVSSLYRSAPLGPPGQADYINAVAELRTDLAPLVLLDALQSLETRHGRRREVHWGARTLDLDILLYGDASFQHDRLRIPHPEMSRRPFVLQPLVEIGPELEVPGLGKVADLCVACDPWPIERLVP